MDFVECEIVVGSILPGQYGPCVPCIRDIGIGRCLVAVGGLIVVILADASVASVYGNLRLQHQARDGCDLQIGTANEACGLNVLLVVVALVHQRVDMCRVPDVRRLVDGAVSLVCLCDAGHLACTVEHRCVSCIMVYVGKGSRSAHLEILVDDVIYVDTSVVSAHGIVLQQALVAHGGERQREVCLFIAAADAGLIVLRGGVLQDGVIPVRIVVGSNEVGHLVLVVASDGRCAEHVFHRIV